VLLLLRYFIIEKIFKVFDKVSEKFDLVRNWTVISELMSLPVAIISSLITKSLIIRFFFQSVDS